MGSLTLGILVAIVSAHSLLCSAQPTCPDRCSCYPDAMTRLGVVDCSNLGLTSIPDIYYPAGGNIFKVDLSNNMLPELDIEKLFGLIQGLRVDILDFSINNINRVTGVFDSSLGKDYVTLNLSSNAFTTFPSNVIPKTHGRDELILDFSNNMLTELTRRMFDGGDSNLFGFQFLASNNRISRIDDEAFQGPTITDTVLDIRSNQLSTLSESFQLPRGVREFRFSDNPWKCDCNLRWIIAPSRSIINVTENDPPNCMEPASLRGQPLFKFKQQDFACLPFQEGQLRRDINDQDTFTLSCPTSADPPNPVITWTVWLPCPDGGNPLRFSFESEEITLGNIVKSPRAAFRCTASNNAGTVDFDLDIRYNGVMGIPIPEVSKNTAPSNLPTGVTMVPTTVASNGGNGGDDEPSSSRPVAGIIILLFLLLISWALIGFLLYRIWVLGTNQQHRGTGNSRNPEVDYQANGKHGNGATVHAITGGYTQEPYTAVERGHSDGMNGWAASPVANGIEYATPHRNAPIKPAVPVKPALPFKPPTPMKPPAAMKPVNPYQYNTEQYDDPPLRFNIHNDGYDYNDDYNNKDSVI